MQIYPPPPSRQRVLPCMNNFGPPMAAALRSFLVSVLVSSLLTSTLSLSEPDALLKFKDSITHNGVLDSWEAGKPPCEGWIGIVCSGGKVTGLHLPSKALSGNIDVNPLLDIKTLRTLSFANNNFSGQIPKFNRLGPLKSLFISKNSFSGEIPTDFFGQMLSLKKIWLNDNDFSGKIPDSLSRLSYLMELHLDGNQFSGEIPSIKSERLTSVDLSRNKLTGEIPESLSELDATVFAENKGLCGKPLGNECPEDETREPTAVEPDDDNTESPSDQNPAGTKTAAFIVMGLLVVGIVFVVLFSSKQRREDDFTGTAKDRAAEPKLEPKLPPAAPKSSAPSSESGSRKGSKRGSQSGKPSSDIVMVNEEKGTFGLSDLMKASAEVLGNGALGSAYKAIMSNGLSVVVKRMREMNAFPKEGFDAEMRRLGRLRHPNILTPLAYHYRREEKLLVSEHIPKGSLLYVLHGDRGMSHAELNWPTRYKIIRGIARGLGFLHTAEFSNYDLPHGNLKSSNVLLGETYEPVLSDYAFYPLMSSPQSAQAMFAFKSPESSVRVSPKCDVFCLGVVMLEILTGKFPSQYLSNSKGGTDVVQWAMTAISEKRAEEIIDPAIATAAEGKAEMVKLLLLASACTDADPEKRVGLTEAIRTIEELRV